MTTMDSEPHGASKPAPGQDQPAEDVTDLEYDLAHEAMSSGADDSERGAPMTQVVTHTETADGDYGYDMSHDVSP